MSSSGSSSMYELVSGSSSWCDSRSWMSSLLCDCLISGSSSGCHGPSTDWGVSTSAYHGSDAEFHGSYAGCAVSTTGRRGSTEGMRVNIVSRACEGGESGLQSTDDGFDDLEIMFYGYVTSCGFIVLGCESTNDGPGSLMLSLFFLLFFTCLIGFEAWWLHHTFKNGFFLVWLMFLDL